MADQNTSERRPSYAEVIRRHLSAFSEELRVSAPAKVVKFDKSTGKADCKILVQNPYVDEEAQRQVESIPVVPCVPVVFPGTGVLRLTFPISDGTLVIPGVNGGQPLTATTGLLVFTDLSLDKWLTGTGSEVDPEIDHRHALTDAVFLPGLFPFGNVPGAIPADHLCLGDDNGSDWVALAQACMTNFNLLFNLLDGLGGALAAPIVATSPPANDAFQTALKAAINTLATSWKMTAVAASQVKAK